MLWVQPESVDSANIAQEMERKHLKKLASFELKLIVNSDETRLFFKMLPRTAYLSSREICATTPRPKGIRTKDRLTMSVCINALCSLKVALAIMGNSKNPRCFPMEKPPWYYMLQDIAWSDKRTSREWFLRIPTYCEGICDLLQKDGPFYIKLCRNDKDDLGHDRVELYCLLTNCTAI